MMSSTGKSRAEEDLKPDLTSGFSCTCRNVLAAIGRPGGRMPIAVMTRVTMERRAIALGCGIRRWQRGQEFRNLKRYRKTYVSIRSQKCKNELIYDSGLV